MRLRHALVPVVLVATVAACGDDAGPTTGPGSTVPAVTTPATTTPTSSDPATSTGSGSTAATTAGGPGTTAVPPATAAGPVRVALVTVAEIEQPVAVAHRTGDPTLFVVAQAGRVHAVREGADPVTVLDVSDHVRSGGEQGLLGLAFSLDGTAAYINYTDTSGDGQIDAYAVAADGTFDPASRRAVYHVNHPDEYSNHNGGNIVTGPDGLLYIGTGDGGGGGDPLRSAQDLGQQLGKLLRLDPTPSGDQGFTVPADNPFVGQAGALGEIWSYGLRNPWRYSFDRATGDLWIGDVGQGDVEEVDWVTAAAGAGKAANFGWSAFEGSQPFNGDQQAPGHVPPVYEYPHADGNVAITGGFVYRGTKIPALAGAYVFGDSGSGRIWAYFPGSGSAVQIAQVDAVVSFGEDEAGELYVTSLATNQVYRFT